MRGNHGNRKPFLQRRGWETRGRLRVWPPYVAQSPAPAAGPKGGCNYPRVALQLRPPPELPRSPAALPRSARRRSWDRSGVQRAGEQAHAAARPSRPGRLRSESQRTDRDKPWLRVETNTPVSALEAEEVPRNTALLPTAARISQQDVSRGRSNACGAPHHAPRDHRGQRKLGLRARLAGPWSSKSATQRATLCFFRILLAARRPLV